MNNNEIIKGAGKMANYFSSQTGSIIKTNSQNPFDDGRSLATHIIT